MRVRSRRHDGAVRGPARAGAIGSRLRTTVALLLLVTGCVAGGSTPDGSEGGAPAAADLPPATLACDDAVDALDEVGSGHGVVLDVVALPTSDSAATALQTTTDPAGGFFAKSGLLVRTGASLGLSVPQELRGRMSIGWGNAGRGTWDLTVPGCEGDREWLAFAGGYWVGETACVPLVVRSGGREARVTIGVGAPCPGQDPPTAPSAS